MTSQTNPAAVVVGAGPYGLSAAAHLIGRGVSVRVFGEPMDAWRNNMPVGMFLKSEPTASSLSAPIDGYTIQDYCVSIGEPPIRDPGPVPIQLFSDYGMWFQERLVPVERERVTNVVRANGGFEVTLGSGESIRTTSVVMAAGHVQFSYLPPVVAALAHGEPLPTARVSHTSQHRDLSVFAGSDVAVIGAGQSALETAALLHEAGAGVTLLVRENKVLWAGAPTGKEGTLLHTLLKPPSGLGPGGRCSRRSASQRASGTSRRRTASGS